MPRQRLVDARRTKAGRVIPPPASRDHGTPELIRHKHAVFGDGPCGDTLDRMALDHTDPIHLMLARGLLSHDQATAAREFAGLYYRAIGKPHPRTGDMGMPRSGATLTAHDRMVAERALDECYDCLVAAGGLDCLRVVNRYAVHRTWDWLPEDVRRHRTYRAGHMRRFALIRTGLDALLNRRRIGVSPLESALAGFQEMTGEVAP